LVPRERDKAAPEIGDALSAKAKIAQKAIYLLSQEPEGLRHSVLLARLKAELPGTPVNTIRGALVGLTEYQPQDIYRPARGLFQHTKYRETENPMPGEALAPASTAKEEDFYASFADYLTEDLEECTKCIPLGGCTFQDKWGTPDVIGIRKARELICRYRGSSIWCGGRGCALHRSTGRLRPD
jgi:hypothetical protein